MRLPPPGPEVTESSNQLKQFSVLIDPGTVLFLRKDREAAQCLGGTGLHKKALGHPCVVIDISQDGQSAMILMMSTFGGNSLESFLQQEYWQDYLPIAPTPCNPVFPGIQLHAAAHSTHFHRGYVNIVDRHWVPWDMLRKWHLKKPVDFTHFDEDSVNTILYFLEWATYDPAGDVVYPQAMDSIPQHLRRNRYPILATRNRHTISTHQAEVDALKRLEFLRTQRQCKRISKNSRHADGECSDSESAIEENHELDIERQLKFRQKLNMLLVGVVVGIFLFVMHPKWYVTKVTS